jgi:hypothetical protein
MPKLKWSSTSTRFRRQPKQLFRWNDRSTQRRFRRLALNDGLEAVRAALDDTDHVAVYHGCRITSTSSYYKHGLWTPNIQELTTRAEKIFLSYDFPNVTRSRFNELTERERDRAQASLYVVLDSDGFIATAGHYLIYGSEHIQALANGCGFPLDELKTFGIPTLFEIHVPTDEIPESQLVFLAKTLLLTFKEHDIPNPTLYDASLQFPQPFPAEWIKRHAHPEAIIDHVNMDHFRRPYCYLTDRPQKNRVRHLSGSILCKLANIPGEGGKLEKTAVRTPLTREVQ